MHIVVVSSRKETKKQFGPLDRSRKYSIEYLEPKKVQGYVKKLQSDTLVYLDAADFSLDDLKKKMTLLEKNDFLRFGILDKQNSVKDIAELFHKGAVDYIGGHLLKDGVTTKRITSVLEYRPFDESAEAECGVREAENNWKVVKNGWKEIKTGNEYTFWLLYIELDMIDEWKKKSGKAHIDDVQRIFHRHVESSFTPLNGKIWMWMNQKGILLFPFDGETCEPILMCIRFVLNRTLISIEEFGYNSTISYKMGLHLGNTMYRDRGKTGGIISDTVNFVFHLGQQHAKDGNLYITQPVYPFLPEKIRKLFIKGKKFEDTEIYSMKQPKS